MENPKKTSNSNKMPPYLLVREVKFYEDDICYQSAST